MTREKIIEMAHRLDYDRIMTMARHYEWEFRKLDNKGDLYLNKYTCDVIRENAFEIYDQPFVYQSIQRYFKNKNLKELDIKLISYNFLKKHAGSLAE